MSYVIVAALFVLSPLLLFHALLKSTTAEPPLLKGRIPLLGVALDFVNGPQPLLERARKKYGWIFTLYIGGRRMTVVSDPVVGMRQVYSQSRNFDAHAFFKYLNIQLFKYTPRINSDAAFQEALLRHVVSYLAAPANVEEIASVMRKEYRALVDENSDLCTGDYADRNGTVVDLYNFARQKTYIAAAIAVFGKAFPAKEIYTDYITYEDSLSRFIKSYPYIFNKRGVDARGRVLEYLADFFTDNEKSSQSSSFITGISDLFRKFGYLSPDDLSGYFLSIVFASKSNSVPMAFWYLAFIIHDEQFRGEVMKIITSHYNSTTQDFDWQALYRDELLNSAFKETARLVSNITSGRVVCRDSMIKIADSKAPSSTKEFYLRKGDSVLVLASMSHWDGEAFPEPMLWNARRFMPENSGKLIKHDKASKDGDPQWKAYIPWGGGGHMCPGRHLAIVEAITQLVYVLWYFDVEKLSADVPQMNVGENYGSGVLKPSSTYNVRFRRREAPATKA